VYVNVVTCTWCRATCRPTKISACQHNCCLWWNQKVEILQRKAWTNGLFTKQCIQQHAMEGFSGTGYLNG